MRTVEEIERRFLGDRTAWDQNVLQQLIEEKVEESYELEYKGIGTLDTGKRDEITKSVSAMANSAGGVVIFGISEYQDEKHRHLPEKLEPIERSKFSREKLDQILSQIQPIIENVRIIPITIEDVAEKVVYVVVVPQSTTAHQATNLRYYSRSNDRSEAMRDYQIRDVMNRVQHPRVTLSFDLLEYECANEEPQKAYSKYYLSIRASNDGTKMAGYITCFVWIPAEFLPQTAGDSRFIRKHREYAGDYHVFDLSNIRKIAIDKSRKISFPIFEPLQPGISNVLKRLRLYIQPESVDSQDLQIYWEVFADNAPIEKGRSRISGHVTMT